MATNLGVASRTDLTWIRGLIVQDRVALERWSMIVDEVVDSEAEVLRIKQLLHNVHNPSNYEDAVFRTLLFWFNKDAHMMQGLLHLLRTNFLFALARRIEEEFNRRMTSSEPHVVSQDDRKQRVPTILTHLHNADAEHRVSQERRINNSSSHPCGLGVITARLRRICGVTDKQNPPVWFEVGEVLRNFTGRKSQLRQLHTMLADKHRPHQAAENIVSICGLGGVGKSELARKYAWKYRKFYGGSVIWILGETFHTMKDSFTRLAAHIGLQLSPNLKNEQIAAMVYDKLGDHECLFIFDFIEDIEDFKQFKPIIRNPTMSTPHVLVTTRVRDLPPNLDNQLELNCLTSEEAMDFTQNELHESKTQSATKLADTLQNFPLALQQATAYIKKALGDHDGAIEEYVKEFDKCALELLNYVRITAGNEYSLTTFTTWEVTLKRIRGLKNGKSALKVINTLSYLDSNRITVEFLTKALSGDMRTSLNLLRDYSMIDMPKARDLVTIHRLVQDVIRLRLAQSSERGVLKALANAISRTLKEGKNAITDFLKECLSHGLQLFPGRIKYSDFIMGDSSYFTCLLWVCWTLKQHEEFPRLLSYTQHAADVLEVVRGKEHNHTLRMRIWTANSHINLDNKQAASPILNEVLIVCESRGEDGYAVDDTLSLMRSAHLHLGNDAEALPIVEKLIALRVEKNGDTDSEVLGWRSDKAALFANMGRLDEASDLFEDVYQKRFQINGLNDLDTLDVKKSIATVLNMKGEHEKAKRIRTEIYEFCRGFLGEEHPATVRARKDLDNNSSNNNFVWK